VIVIDTNVVSEPLRRAPDSAVVAWLDRQVAETLFLTTTSLSELLVGIETLPEGRRRHGLATDLAGLLNRLFGDRILPFDAACAPIYAAAFVRARGAGRPIAMADGQIAAIAIRHGFTVATRDEAPFLAAGATLVNPWDDPGH
jgi:predicted nucleic acid-binding protein